MNNKFKPQKIHDEQVKEIQQQLNSNGFVSLKKNHPSNTLRKGHYKKSSKEIRLDQLNGILGIDTEKKIIWLEPGITFRDLVNCTLRYKLIPPVVPEFTSITVGGAIMGAALESSSHRFGQVNDTCLEYEVLLGNGELRKINTEKDADLFYAISGSYGTLCLLTSIKMQLIDATRWVCLTYQSFSHADEIVHSLSLPHQEHFVEGIVFSQKFSVKIVGEFTEETSYPLHSFSYPFSKWYCQHVFEMGHKSFYRERMPLIDYLFRLDRGAFWMGRYLLSYPAAFKFCLKQKMQNVTTVMRSVGHKLREDTFPSFLFRLFFGWAITSERLYSIWHKVSSQISENLFFVQDFYLPYQKVTQALNIFLEKTAIFPIWLCPIKGAETPQLLSPHFGKKLFINIGVYGIPKNSLPVPILTSNLEEEIAKMGGKKMLYSYTYYSKELFDQIYDTVHYENIRKKFYSDKTFLPLYNKVTDVLTFFP